MKVEGGYFIIRQNRQGASQERRRIFHHLTCAPRLPLLSGTLTWFWILGHYIVAPYSAHCFKHPTSSTDEVKKSCWLLMSFEISKWLKSNEKQWSFWNVFSNCIYTPQIPRLLFPCKPILGSWKGTSMERKMKTNWMVNMRQNSYTCAGNPHFSKFNI